MITLALLSILMCGYEEPVEPIQVLVVVGI